MVSWYLALTVVAHEISVKVMRPSIKVSFIIDSPCFISVFDGFYSCTQLTYLKAQLQAEDKVIIICPADFLHGSRDDGHPCMVRGLWTSRRPRRSHPAGLCRALGRCGPFQTSLPICQKCLRLGSTTAQQLSPGLDRILA